LSKTCFAEVDDPLQRDREFFIADFPGTYFFEEIPWVNVLARTPKEK
jgi:hypothetical protein